MYRYSLIVCGFVLCSLFLTGCINSAPPSTAGASSTEFRLVTEPVGAVEILDAKDQATDGEPIVLVGRLGGGVNPWIEGRAAFLLVDTRIAPSCDSPDECKVDCPDCAKEMLAASTMVKFLGNDGKVLDVDARKLLGVKEEETVVVEGLVSRDASGNMSVAAKRIYVRP